ncbi:venom protease [Acyrthosiphon pisum]|uniref:CLIP domain-containing serine protease n=1 Tax=Acyrthosiphon pisum TaxID=7029 RepID=A0A8R2D120_ACYPI|nr:venom protease [Acyrthosiphon pisum]|eukprot:XP_003241254.1 PREDICTED: venom protease-like [Acyrthosiphon pisum]
MILPQHFICVAFVIGVATAQSDDECRTPNDENGVCIDIRNCTKLILLLQDPNTTESDLILLRNSICGFEGTTSKVCCPLDKMIPEDKLSSQMTCGQKQLSTDRIIGGSQSQLGAWPWMVALGYQNLNINNNSLQWLCSGTLITNTYVLTSAECVRDRVNIRLTTARLGELNLDPSVSDGANPLDVPIKHIIIHEEYNPEGVSNDIALLKLNHSVAYTELIQPICLPLSPDVRFINLRAIDMPFVAGWGSTNPPSVLSEQRNTYLMEAQIPITNTTDCKYLYKKNNIVIDDKIIICAGHPKGGKDACRGDSGGPMMFFIKNQYYLMGVVSRGPKLCGEPGYPGIYTRVSSFINWIVRRLNSS